MSYDTCLSLSDFRTTSLLLIWDSTYEQRHMTPVFLYLTSEEHHCYLLETPRRGSVIWHLSFSIWRQYDITFTYLRLHVWAASYDTCLSLSDVRTTSLLLTWDSTYKQRHMTPVFLYLTSERHHCYLLETPCMSSVIWHLSFSIRRQRRRQRQRQRQPLGPATLLRMELLRSLSWLSNIPLHVCVTSLSTWYSGLPWWLRQ